jgi:hypothetical protein
MRRTTPRLTVLAAMALAVPAIYLVLPTRAPVPAPGHARVPASGPASRDLFAFLLAHSRDLGPLPPARPVSLLLLLLRDGTAAKQAADLAAMYRLHSPTFGHFKSVKQIETATSS